MTDKAAEELKKLVDIVSDRSLPSKLRDNAMSTIASIGTHEALMGLLNVAGNEAFAKQERELALKYAREIIRAGH